MYIPVVALNLPGAAVLGLAAGALFGALVGTVLISFASSIGATLACALSRYLLRDWVQRRFGDKLKRVNAGIQEEGAFYLFSLRLIPVIPFFIINLVMGLTPIRLPTFYWVSQLGMLPGTAVFVNAGSQLGRIESVAGILSPGIVISLALIGVLPLVVRRALRFYKERFRKGSDIIKPALMMGGKTPPALEPYLKDIRERCTECGACVKSCAFLSHYGTPKAMATGFDFSSPRHQAIAYECSLCSLCSAVCPEKLDPFRLFLEIRRQHVDGGQSRRVRLRGHPGIRETRHLAAVFLVWAARGLRYGLFPGLHASGHPAGSHIPDVSGLAEGRPGDRDRARLLHETVA